MRKAWVVSLVLALAIGAGTAAAQDKVAEQAPKRIKEAQRKKQGEPKVRKPAEARVLQDITVTGTVLKEEKEAKDKKFTIFFLQDEQGNKIRLPAPRGEKGKPGAIDLENFVNARVRVTGKGKEMTAEGKKRVSLASITNVEKLGGGDAEPKVPAGEPEGGGWDDAGEEI